jgi:hypothetical protein
MTEDLLEEVYMNWALSGAGFGHIKEVEGRGGKLRKGQCWVRVCIL